MDELSRPPSSSSKPYARARFAQDVSPRKQQILEIAAQLFARKGYRGTSIRDIGEQSGVLGGSLYHHIKSKDALFVELHNAALDAASDKIAKAIADETDPWSRLETSCSTLLEILLDKDSLTLPLMNDFREVPLEVRRQLIARRDLFEDIFRSLIEDLPLPPDVDRSIYRNTLLALINSTGEWYRPGRLTPVQIAQQITRIFHQD